MLPTARLLAVAALNFQNMGVERTVLREGKGRSPKHAEMVQCHYIGTLVDGTEFDNSR
jgi:FKBP-type peptidyl-prolyl cis-trans isomerase